MTAASVTPTIDYRRTMVRVPRELTRGADARVHAALGFVKRHAGLRSSLWLQARRVDGFAHRFRDLDDTALQECLHAYRDRFRRRPDQPRRVLLEALAALREAAERQTGLRPYRVQIMGVLGLYHGCLVEMATGEGKTLVAAIAATLAGWTRRPCHVITVNDYLAQRDAEWFANLYQFAGTSVGHVVSTMSPEERQRGYDKDVTYTTSKEILADFLRDRLRLGPLQNPERRHISFMQRPQTRLLTRRLVMRGLHTAIVDEADSVLIDEAVTPLIISQPQENRPMTEAFCKARDIAAELEPDRHYRINHRYKEVELTPEGRRRALELNPRVPGLWQAPERWRELLTQALHARAFFLRDQQYVVQDDKVVIVDEFSGRMMPMRTWRHGLHQAIEAKENLEVSSPSETLSRLSFQRFFRFYHKLSGMTGTAAEAAGEFWHIYELPTVRIPTHRRCIRRTRGDRVFATADQKWDAVVHEVLKQHQQDRPVLIGTRSVKDSEAVAERLREAGVEFNLLNAIHHAEEARIVSEAGKGGKITIATNMAGRGTDIKIDDDVARNGGLRVIATERHESGRIDRQLFGRCARQGAPGVAQTFTSLDDNLFVRFTWGRVSRGLLRTLVRLHIPGARFLVRTLVRQCQVSAQRQAYKQRQGVLRMDTWMEDALSFAPGPDRITG